MSNLEILFLVIIGLFGLFVCKRFLESWFTHESEYCESIEEEKPYFEEQKIVSQPMVLEQKSLPVVQHHHYKTENHYHVHQSNGKVRTEKVINPKKLLGE